MLFPEISFHLCTIFCHRGHLLGIRQILRHKVIRQFRCLINPIDCHRKTGVLTCHLFIIILRESNLYRQFLSWLMPDQLLFKIIHQRSGTNRHIITCPTAVAAFKLNSVHSSYIIYIDFIAIGNCQIRIRLKLLIGFQHGVDLLLYLFLCSGNFILRHGNILIISQRKRRFHIGILDPAICRESCTVLRPRCRPDRQDIQLSAHCCHNCHSHDQSHCSADYSGCPCIPLRLLNLFPALFAFCFAFTHLSPCIRLSCLVLCHFMCPLSIV